MLRGGGEFWKSYCDFDARSAGRRFLVHSFNSFARGLDSQFEDKSCFGVLKRCRSSINERSVPLSERRNSSFNRANGIEIPRIGFIDMSGSFSRNLIYGVARFARHFFRRVGEVRLAAGILQSSSPAASALPLTYLSRDPNLTLGKSTLTTTNSQQNCIFW